MPRFISLGEPPDLGERVWWSEDHLVSFVAGWFGAEEALYQVEAQTRKLGFGPNPAEFLVDTLTSLAHHADLLLLVPPMGLGSMPRIAMAASDSVVAFLCTDPIGSFDGGRVRDLIEDIALASLLGPDAMRLCWTRDAESLDAALAADVRRELRRNFPSGRELPDLAAWSAGGARGILAPALAEAIERLVSPLLPGVRPRRRAGGRSPVGSSGM